MFSIYESIDKIPITKISESFVKETSIIKKVKSSKIVDVLVCKECKHNAAFPLGNMYVYM